MSENNFEHILIPFDNSPSSRVALRTAVNIAGRFLAKLSFVHVNNGRYPAERLGEVKEVIEKIKERTGLETNLLTPEGKIDKEIVRISESLGADLIIMGTHGITGSQEFWLGSNAFRVVSSSTIPVITMQETYPKEGFDKIVIPIDDSSESRQKIPMAIQMANYFNAEVVVLGCSKYEGPETEKSVRTYVDQTMRLMEDASIKTSKAFHFGGNIADSTLSYAKGSQADLIIMMSESEPSAGLFMGTNAQRVVNHSTIPVLTVHAKEVFKSIGGL